MNIDQARELKIGDRVMCPADRGDPAYEGKVTTPGLSTYERNNIEFMWISVKGGGKTGTWPSHRLTKV